MKQEHTSSGSDFSRAGAWLGLFAYLGVALIVYLIQVFPGLGLGL